MPHLESRAILITGANGLLGAAMATLFLERDPASHVYLAVRRSRERAEAVRARHPMRAVCLDLDVTQATQWATALEEIERRSGGLSVLINNAGYHDDALLAHMTETQWNEVLATNLSAVFHGCQAALRSLMKSKQGRIINIASLSALHSPPGQANYAAAKAGVMGLTQSLAKETARFGLTVNAIAPGHIEGATPANWSPEQLKAAKMQIPMRRFAKPEEVAEVVFFLASSQAAYITGQTLKLDGGLL